jgi:hypothetical protein
LKSLTSVIENNSGLQLEFGDNAKYVFKGVGTTSFRLKSGKPLNMSEVLCVPRLKKNLLSISAMEDIGNAMAFVDGKVLAWQKGLSLESTEVIRNHDGNLYKMTGQEAQVMVHDSDNLCKLWHRILGHLHHHALPILRKMFTVLPEFGTEHQKICRGCALGKNSNVSFQSSDSRSKKILDIVHSYVCGQISVPSASGFRYYMTFIDDYSRRTWIYFIKTKDEVFSQFKEFKALVENQKGKKIKVLSLDDKGEYTSNEFNNLCKEAWIKREMTFPFNLLVSKY